MFNESRLLDCVAYGSSFGQQFSTRIIQLRSGVERRNIGWALPLGRYSVIYTALRPADHVKVRGAHMASAGSAIPFRFKDWSDYQADSEALGFGTGAVQSMQLVKTYWFGSVSISRIIKKPVLGTVQIYANGAQIASTTNTETGVVTFTADDGAAITWTGEFDVPARFESDQLDVDPVARVGGGFALSADVDLVEVRL